ncbi:MAG: sensor histidine kinase [Planctomycetota bacterium]
MSVSIKKKKADEPKRLRANLRRHRRFVERLCRQMRAELEAVKAEKGERLVDVCSALQANLDAVVDIEHLQSGECELDRDVFDLHTAARTAVARHAFAADEHQVRLRCFVHRESPRRVVGDQARLRRLLSDLVANAILCSARGQVFVFVAPEPSADGDASVRFTVCDQEEGPPPVERLPGTPHVGDPGWVTPWYSMVRELVRRMGGDVGFTASDDGVALWFTVSLSTTLPQPKRSELASHAPVLLVTQSSERAAAIANALHRCGLDVETEALQQLLPVRLQEKNYSLALLDVAGAPEQTTYAAKPPGATDVRSIPILGVPRRRDKREAIDEAALLQMVQKRVGTRLSKRR